MTAFNLTSLIIAIGILQSAFSLEDYDATKDYVSRKTQTLTSCKICDLGGGEPVSTLIFESIGFDGPTCDNVEPGPPLLSCEDVSSVDVVRQKHSNWFTGTVRAYDGAKEIGRQFFRERFSNDPPSRLHLFFTDEVP